MSESTQKTTIQLLPGGTVLTIVFVLLKAYGKIDWSWWWVFSPLWIPIAIFLGVMAVIAIFALIVAAID
jgi:hypothetical protein